MLHPAIPTRSTGAPIDSPVAGHDGLFWPLFRGEMITPDQIRDRMAQDMLAHITRHGDEAGVTEGDLGRLGWAVDQIRTHGGHARERFTVMLAKARGRRCAL